MEPLGVRMLSLPRVPLKGQQNPLSGTGMSLDLCGFPACVYVGENNPSQSEWLLCFGSLANSYSCFQTLLPKSPPLRRPACILALCEVESELFDSLRYWFAACDPSKTMGGVTAIHLMKRILEGLRI